METSVESLFFFDEKLAAQSALIRVILREGAFVVFGEPWKRERLVQYCMQINETLFIPSASFVGSELRLASSCSRNPFFYPEVG